MRLLCRSPKPGEPRREIVSAFDGTGNNREGVCAEAKGVNGVPHLLYGVFWRLSPIPSGKAGKGRYNKKKYA